MEVLKRDASGRQEDSRLLLQLDGDVLILLLLFSLFYRQYKKTDTTTKTETLKQCEAVFIFRSEYTENIKCTHKITFLAYFPYWLKREGRNGCITFAGASFHLPLRRRNKNKFILCSFAEALYEFKPSTSPSSPVGGTRGLPDV